MALTDGRTCKRRQTSLRGILDQFDRPHAGDADARTLIITEGGSHQKAAEIVANPYLAFALRMLRECDAPLVLFGHSLGGQDEHLLEAINAHPDRRVAVSMLDRGRAANRRRKYEVQAGLLTDKICFFEASTHPLGAKKLRVAGRFTNPFVKGAARRALGRVAR